MKAKLACSFSYDPWYDMAFEEYLLNNVVRDEVILYLWQSDHTVLIGKHQNAWRECSCKQLEDDGGKLARRLSGGGAVYQDLGNLNFTFIMDRELYDLEKQLGVILNAVNNLGIRAEFTGRNDITVDGKKFSGNAFCFKSESALHHGTILVDTDFSRLARYLRPSKEKIMAKGVDPRSVQSRVVNLSSINSGINMTVIKEALEDSFVSSYGELQGRIQIDDMGGRLDNLYRKYSSWEWNYGETPEFNINLGKRFDWGEIEICLGIEDGYIKTVVVYSDAMDTELIDDLAVVLRGIPFCKEGMISKILCIGESAERESFVKDLSKWLDTKPI